MDLKGQPVPQVTQARQVLQGPRVIQGHKVSRGSKEYKACKVQLVRQAVPDLLVMMG